MDIVEKRGFCKCCM